MDDLSKLQSDASEYGSPGDRERAAAQQRTLEQSRPSEALDEVLAGQEEAVEPGGAGRVDPVGRPMSEDEERPVADPEAAPHHDQLDTPPAQRSIGRDVRSSSQNGMGITR